MNNSKGKFRFAYFTSKYQETINFYQNTLSLNLAHSWNRNDSDQGAVFEIGVGLIEILKLPNNNEFQISGLDYRNPQGAFMVIQVFNVNQLFKQYRSKGIPFKQELTDQSWGHRSFSIIEPNGLILFFFQEQF